MFIFISFVLTMLLTTNFCFEAWEISSGTRLPANLPSLLFHCCALPAVCSTLTLVRFTTVVMK